MLNQKSKLFLLGFILALGSPLGWLLVRFGLNSTNEPLRWFLTELRENRVLYAYITLGTMLSFGAFSYFVGELLQKITVRDKLLENKSKDYMKIVGLVAHELRAPLTSVKGRLDLALYKTYGVLNPELRDALQKARFGCDQLNQMISSYLNLARIERGELNVHFRSFDLLKEVIRPLIEEMQMNLEGHGMKLDVQGVDLDSVCNVNGDPQWLQVAFRNLITNAIRYGFYGTTVELRFSQKEFDVHLEVFNRGYGIPEDYLQKIFNKFVKVPREGKVGESGTGLGLFIVKEIIDQHRGTMCVESKFGEWANFIVTLPKSRE